MFRIFSRATIPALLAAILFHAAPALGQNNVFPELEALQQNPRLEISASVRSSESTTRANDPEVRTDFSSSEAKFLLTGKSKGDGFLGFSQELATFEFEDSVDRVEITVEQTNFMASFKIDESLAPLKLTPFTISKDFVWEGDFERKTEGVQLTFRFEQTTDASVDNSGIAFELFFLKVGFVNGEGTVNFHVISPNGVEIRENYTYEFDLQFIGVDFVPEEAGGFFLKTIFRQLLRPRVEGETYDILKTRDTFWRIAIGQTDEAGEGEGSNENWTLFYSQNNTLNTIETLYLDEDRKSTIGFEKRFAENITLMINASRNNINTVLSDGVDTLAQEAVIDTFTFGFNVQFGGDEDDS